MTTAFFAILLVASAFFSTAGSRDHMPAREPLVLAPHEVCTERWTCHDPSALTALWEATAQGKRPLRIASYNVHKCTGMDFRRDPARIAEVIRSLDADVIALQEVLSDPGTVPAAQMRLLAEKTGMYMAVAGPTKRKKDGSYGNALLSRFPITAVRLHDISLGAFEPRGIIDADIMVGDLTVRVVATHLGLWPVERSRQVDRLLEILSGNPESPLIVMGDMNSWAPGSSALRRLYERLGTPVAALRSYPAPLPLVSLDRIWVLPSERLRAAGVSRSRLPRVASDHLPAVAEVYFRMTSQEEPSVASDRTP